MLQTQEDTARRMYKPPAFFTLTTNFRSVGGIVACGQTVLDLISKYWPDSVDYVPKEGKLSPGSLPYFFRNTEGTDIDLKGLMRSSKYASQLSFRSCTELII